MTTVSLQQAPLQAGGWEGGVVRAHGLLPSVGFTQVSTHN